ncbi:MAG: hypothetical protein ACOYO1_16165 [Bacteroidales bacterium]
MTLRKLSILILCLFAFQITSYSQIRGDIRAAAMSEVSFFNSGTLTSYGISAEYFIHKNFSLNYQYSFGFNQNKNTYIHFPGALAGFIEMIRSDSYFLTSGADDEGWTYLLLLTFVLPEGISFHTYPRNWIELAPFINPLSTDYNLLGNYRSTITLSIGMKLHIKPVETFSISPHAGLKYIYGNGKTGNYFGISMGWLF